MSWDFAGASRRRLLIVTALTGNVRPSDLPGADLFLALGGSFPFLPRLSGFGLKAFEITLAEQPCFSLFTFESKYAVVERNARQPACAIFAAFVFK